MEQTASCAGASCGYRQRDKRKIRRGFADFDRLGPAVTLLDWLLIAILVYSIVMSWLKGFIREVLGLITVLAALLLAAWFYRGFANMFKDVVRTENLALFRSEEHTSELQSHHDLVCRLLLEKKKK